jgi:phenylpropionate dioxygenase-like ring-hydroxylating dioxygenase large terminal subunit
MIKNQWYAIMLCKEVKKKPVGVIRMGEKLVLWRDDNGELNCIYDRCCHRGASLSLGKVVHGKVECPFHGLLYDGSGKVTTIPANGKFEKVSDRYKVFGYKVIEDNGLVWIWYGDQNYENKPEVPFFKDLKEGFKYSTFSEVWDVHYTRAIENQLDVVHLPFVHKTTIGKGHKTLINGPVVKWNENLMTIYVNNIFDNGNKKALKSTEIKDYENLFSLQFQIPNIWQNRISDKVKVFIAFAPIDDKHTKIYLRFYQSFLPVPGLGDFVASIGNIFNRIILHQDRKIVLTQLPIKSELKMDEKLIPGDLPIIQFRKRRDDLINS